MAATTEELSVFSHADRFKLSKAFKLPAPSLLKATVCALDGHVVLMVLTEGGVYYGWRLPKFEQEFKLRIDLEFGLRYVPYGLMLLLF